METGRSAARWGIVWAVRSPPRWKTPSHSARRWIHRFAREHCHRPTDSWNIYNGQTISVTATSPIGRERCRAVILSSCSPSSSAFSRHILATDHQPLVLLRSSRCTVMRSSQYTFSFRFSLFRYLTVWSRTIKKWYRAVSFTVLYHCKILRRDHFLRKTHFPVEIQAEMCYNWHNLFQSTPL